ncbi:zinc-binding alcohol dehydrogenase [Fulvivirgaceae bacterium BMA12]|uniref:Zinc-binding alcohol dehydrogenase n=1 Tax=Agaribacillus aureus TaxID=3051825 RepID=A0ABT8L2P3_9BACT|nr:zinc-binding alcohol dehydrogenase [Fulvivirgaceae bacterium BMA12]
METTALWHLSASSTILKTTNIRNDHSVSCLIKSLYSLISTGTERLVAQGKVPDNLQEAMKVPYMEGSFGFPLTYGYSLVGEVIEGPEHLIGKNVHIMHPHQSMLYANQAHIAPIPEDIPSKRAVLVSNLETAVNAVWDSEVTVGEKVLVAGFGIIGALLCQILRKFPAIDLQVLEPNQTRREMARSWGFNVAETITLTEPSFDVAFNTSSHENGLQFCIDSVGYEGKVVELSWYGDQSVNINLGKSFHHLRKQIISSQVSQIPGHKLNRWDHQRRKALVFDLLKDPFFDELLTDEISFQDSPVFFQDLRNGTIDSIGTTIKY